MTKDRDSFTNPRKPKRKEVTLGTDVRSVPTVDPQTILDLQSNNSTTRAKALLTVAEKVVPAIPDNVGLIKRDSGFVRESVLKAGGSQAGYLFHDGTNVTVMNVLSNSVNIGTGGTVRLAVSNSGVISDQSGNELGYKGLPQNNQTIAYTLVAADKGKHIYQRSAVAVTVPSGVFSVGDAVTIVNGTSSSITLTQGASATLQLAGSASTGSRTILPNGVCSIICVSSNLFYVTGNVT